MTRAAIIFLFLATILAMLIAKWLSGEPVAFSNASSGSSWTFWLVLLGFICSPVLVAIAMDGKGQAAAGWLVFAGFIFSAILAVIYFFGLAVWLVISSIFS